MRPIHSLLACVLGLAGLSSGNAVAGKTDIASRRPAVAVTTGKASSAQPPVKTTRVGVWQPPPGLKQIPIWPHAVPPGSIVPRAPESVLTAQTPEALAGTTSQGIYDVAAPTLTVFPPKGRNTGAAMVVFPGGGFVMLAITIEGTEVCDWITSKGMTCILAKYRVPGGNHHYDKDCNCAVTPRVPFALQDAQRAIRLVRANAEAWRIDPARIGVIGFSAGGYLVAQTSNLVRSTYAPVDAVDRLSSRPDFAIALYPGHLCRPGGKFDPGLHVTPRTPPTFLVQAWDDPVDPICNSTLYARALADADVPAEVHLFAKGGHAFGLRRTPHPVAMWPSLVERWLAEIGML